MWRILKPQVITAFLVVTLGSLIFLTIKFIVDFIIAGTDVALDMNSMSASQQVSSLGLMSISPMIITIVVLFIIVFYLKNVFEDLKPCFVQDVK